MLTLDRLDAHYEANQALTLAERFAADSTRFSRFSLEAAGLLCDYSKNHCSEQTLALLIEHAQVCGLTQKTQAMFAGKPINNTENRAVGHVALRMNETESFVVDGQNQVPQVLAVKARCYAFVNQVRHGQWLGGSGLPITDVVNIGIGGSDLGPQMVTLALRQWASSSLKVHYVSNVDGQDLFDTLGEPKQGGLNPHTTLFIIASKTFTTQETMANAHSAKRWFADHGGKQVAQHFVAVSTNLEAVQAFGIAPDNMFSFKDWVGGRYSVWSAIGLSVMIAIGPQAFDQFLAGARQMDQHFINAPLESNMPVLLALLDVWYRGWWGIGSRCIAPYHHRLRRLPAYMQQLDMESLGKSVKADGTPLDAPTGLIVWGEPGTNGQHAYFQLLHQGTNPIAVDFIAAAKSDQPNPDQQTKLLANCLAQSQALMMGRTLAQSASPHQVCEGNRPSNTILMQSLTPATLGALIALYEHKVFVCASVWGINAFDQWGVELGKSLAKGTEQLLTAPVMPDTDSSTAGLANALKNWF